MNENNILNNPEPFAAPVEIEEKVIEPKSEEPAGEEGKASGSIFLLHFITQA